MSAKSKVQIILLRFLTTIQTQFRTSIKNLCCDNGGEFLGLAEFFRENEINHQTTIPYKWQGRKETSSYFKRGSCLSFPIKSSGLVSFWGDCVLTAQYLINHTLSNLLNAKLLLKSYMVNTRNMTSCIPLGCLCYIHHSTIDKFHSRRWKCVSIGYPLAKKGWRVYDLSSKEFLVSRDVVFFEHIFPLQNSSISLFKQTRFSFFDESTPISPKPKNNSLLSIIKPLK